jgi:hypothetical protein
MRAPMTKRVYIQAMLQTKCIICQLRLVFDVDEGVTNSAVKAVGVTWHCETH